MKRSISVLCLAMFLASPGFAQPAQVNPKSPGMADQTEVDSQSFAARAAMDGMFEVQSGALAQMQGVDAKVKEFGHRMVTDHGAANTKLKQIAGSSLQLPTRLDAEHQAKLDKLRGLQGQAFDTAYSGEMMKGHDQAVELFTKASTSLRVSADLQTFAKSTLPTLQEHQMLAMALPGPPR